MMNQLFIFKLLTSFVVGGSVIALLGYLAENANRKIAGVVISLPSTVVISYMFIAWTLNTQAVANAVPATITTSGAIQIFAITYYYLSRIKFASKWISLIISISGSILSWMIIAIPVVIIKLSNIYHALLFYSLFTILAYYLLTIKNTNETKLKKIHYSNMQLLGRAFFAGTIISLSVLLANILNPFWGGIFASFPAVFSSTFLILHYYQGHEMIAKVTKSIPLGSIIYVAFTFSARYTFPRFGIIGGMISAYAVSLILFFIVFKGKTSK